MFTMLLQTFINGINIGSLYGLSAVGLSLTFGVMKILNIAHGEFLTIGGYFAFWFFTLWGLDPIISLFLVFILSFVLGIIFYKLTFAKVARLMEEVKVKNSLLIGFGLFLILPQIDRLLWTSDERAITPFYSGMSFPVLGARVGLVPLIGLIVSIVAIVALHFFLTKTFLGKAVRGTSQNWRAAKLMGINVDRTYLVTFAIGIGLAGVAGVMVALTQAITPDVGMPWTLKALIVVVLAGIGSVGGSFIAGMILGVVEAMGAIWMGPYTVALGLVLFLAILMFRPQGLLAKIKEHRMSKGKIILISCGAIILLALLPLTTERTDFIQWGCLTLLYILLSQSWNIIGGIAGQQNLGHAAFIGLGAITTRFLWINFGVPLPLTLLIGGVAALIFALIIGLPAFRLKGVYFIIGTLVLAEILHVIFNTTMPRAMVLPGKFIGTFSYVPRYYTSLLLAILSVAVVLYVSRSRLGLGLMAIRENEDAAEATGVSASKYKMIAFALSTFMAGVGGGYYAYFTTAMQPGYMFAPEWTFDAVLIVFVGGVGTVVGPIIGSVFFVLLRQLLSLYLPGGAHVLVFGILFIIVVLFLPGGLIELMHRIKKRLWA